MKRGKISNSMRQLRATQGAMTQADLARSVGVTRQTIIAIEQGKYSPSLESAFLIAGALGTPLGEVFSYSDAPGD